MTDRDVKIEGSVVGSGPVGLALGSGAARGLSYIGVIKALEEAGVEISCLAGTSIGAMIGAIYASGVPIDRMEQVARSLNWQKLTRLLDPIIPTSGLIDGKKVGRFIDDLLPVKSFEELQRPLAVTATDVESGELVVIRKGNLLEAVQAAIAFPGLFTPVRFGDRFLVDGGLCAPVPTDIARDMGADRVISVCAIPEIEKIYTEASSPAHKKEKTVARFLDHFNSEWIENRFREVWQGKNGTNNRDDRRTVRKPPSIFRVFAQSVAIMENRITEMSIDRTPADLLIRPDLKDITLLEFHRAGECIEAGKQAVRSALKTF